eukprot:Platyproteum_vivax@DN7193_c0_g1_i2.p1
MVSFTCDACQDVVKKPKVENHCATKCRNAWVFTCVDCSVAFQGYEYQKHDSCITETQKYWGKFAKDAKKNEDASPGSTASTAASVKSDACKKRKLSVTYVEVKWGDSWVDTINKVLEQQPGKRMRWYNLSNKVAGIYIEKEGLKPSNETKRQWRYYALTQIPEEYLSETDNWVTMN